MGALQHGLAMEVHQRMHEAFVGARADAEDYGLVATLRRQIGVAHRRIDVDRLTFLQHDRVVKLGMNHNPSLEPVEQPLALWATTSEHRRVGKEGVSRSGPGWAPNNIKK